MPVNITPFSISGISLGITCTILLFFLFLHGKTKLHYIWVFFNISVAIWGYFAFIIGGSTSLESSLIYWKLAFVGVIFIAIFFYHFVYIFCNLKKKYFLIFAYAQGLLFLGFDLFSKVYIHKVLFLWNRFYYLESAGILFPLSFALWLFLVVVGHIELIKYFQTLKGVKRSQALYLFVGFIVGFLGGTTNFFPMFGLTIYPYGNFTVSLYCIITTYAILRYQLLDIKIAITRVGVFALVYGLVLGIPFLLGLKLLGTGLWMLPVSIMALFSTLGPFIYLFIQKKAEDKLLQEQRRYQFTLRQASSGMGRIKDLKKLVTLIVYIITRSVRIEHSIVYVLDDKTNKMLLGAYKNSNIGLIPREVSLDSAVITYLNETRSPIVHEEIRQKIQDYKDLDLESLEDELIKFDASIVVPSWIEDRLIGILIMGKKLTGRPYSEDDLSVFTILANQAALAIENAMFHENGY